MYDPLARPTKRYCPLAFVRSGEPQAAQERSAVRAFDVLIHHKPDRGLVTLAYRVKNQLGETVLTMRAVQIIRRRAT